MDTFKPRFIFAPPEITAAGHVQAAIVKDRHPAEVARAFPAIAVVAVDVRFRGGGIEIELPYLPESWINRLMDCWVIGRLRRSVVCDRVKGIENAVAGGEEEQRAAIRSEEHTSELQSPYV